MSAHVLLRCGALAITLGGCAWFGSFEHAAAKLTVYDDSCPRCDWTQTDPWPESSESFWVRIDGPEDKKFDLAAIRESSEAGEAEAQDCARELAQEAGPRSYHPPEMIRAIMIIDCMEHRGWELEVIQTKVTVTS